MESRPRERDVATFGETMLRLSPPGSERLQNAPTLDVAVGGAESNVAAALVCLGRSVSWWSRLADDPRGRRICAEITARGVATDTVLFDRGKRAGVYYVEFATPPRHTSVLYDRLHSAASTISQVDVPLIGVEQARVLYVTGITPCLGKTCAAAFHEAVAAAVRADTAVILDVNYRPALTSPEELASLLEPILANVDLLIVSRAEARILYGIEHQATPVAAAAIRDRFRCGAVVVTNGQHEIGYVQDGPPKGFAPEPWAPHTQEGRLGRGDAFAAGVVDGWLSEDLDTGIMRGAAMARLKMTMPGDMLTATREEIDTAMAAAEPTVIR